MSALATDRGRSSISDRNCSHPCPTTSWPINRCRADLLPSTIDQVEIVPGEVGRIFLCLWNNFVSDDIAGDRPRGIQDDIAHHVPEDRRLVISLPDDD